MRDRFRRAFHRQSVSGEEARAAVEEELALHLELVARELMAAGVRESEAWSRARREFGDLEFTKQYCAEQSTRQQREEGGRMWVESLVRDVSHGARSLMRSPGYTLVVVVTLMLGIASNTLIFSLMSPYFVRDLPFGDPDRLVQLGLVHPTQDWDGVRFSLPQYLDWRARAESFEDLALYRYTQRNVSGDGGSPDRVMVGELTGNMFSVLEVEAALGRTFTASEGGPGAAPVVVLSDGVWRSRWGGDAGVVGRQVRLDGEPHTVLGIMPAAFNFPFGGVKMWVPLRDDPTRAARSIQGLIMVGRLAEGWTAERAHGELSGIHQDLSAAYPDVDGAYPAVSLKPMREALNFAYEMLRTSFLVLLIAVGAVLLIACVNVASLTLVRGVSRSREMALRAAVGAGRGRLVRQLLTESVLLTLAGGVPGVLLAVAAVSALGPLIPEDLYRVGGFGLDGHVLHFAVAVSVVTALVFGLAPALRASRTDLVTALKEGGAGAGTGRAQLRGQRTLVVVQVVGAIVLVTAAGLMARSFARLQAVELGFRTDRILTVEVIPPQSDYPSSADYARYYEQARLALAGIPGVEAVGMVYPLPLNHENIPVRFAPSDGSFPAEDWPSALIGRASSDYFRSMGIPLVAGRSFQPGDGEESARVAIVSRSAAERYWDGTSPIGRTVLYGDPEDPGEATVVGVVADIRHEGIDSSPRPHLYFPQAQVPTRRRFLTIGTTAEHTSLTAQARARLEAVDRALPVTIRPMRDVVRESTVQWALGSSLLAAFALIGTALAGIGIYGVIAYTVSQRRRELGVRMALGATRPRIRAMVLREGARLVVVGLAIGIVLALVAGRLMASLLFGVSAYDWPTLLGVAVLFSLIALGASLLPALRAARTSTLEVLRYE